MSVKKRQPAAPEESPSLGEFRGMTQDEIRYALNARGQATGGAGVNSKPVAPEEWLGLAVPYPDAQSTLTGLSGPEVAKEARLLELRDYRVHMIKHIDWCCRVEDWHGVSDAANDLRETDCELRCLEDPKWVTG